MVNNMLTEVKKTEEKKPEAKPAEKKAEPKKFDKEPGLNKNGRKNFRILVVDHRRCVGCEICESTCSVVHDSEFNPMNSRINRIRIEPVINNAMNCLKCHEPHCVKACQIGALSQDSVTGVIHVDQTKCDGCAACQRACPYGAINIHTKMRKAIVCDLCESTPEKYPQCAEICPKGAIFVEEIDPDIDEERFETVAKIVKRGFPGSGMLN